MVYEGRGILEGIFLFSNYFGAGFQDISPIQTVDSTTNGMLGGFAFISKQDIRDSRKFLQEFLDGKYGFRLGTNAALGRVSHLQFPRKVISVLSIPASDCGAGIGRVSKFLLLPIFQRVDLLEQNGSFLEKAKSCLNSPKVGRYIQRGLQDFMFSELGGTSSSTEVSTCSSSIDSNDKEASSNFSFSGSYDLVWIQWVSGHLVDDHLVRCLRRCRKALSECGLIVIKENVCSDGHFHVDLVDSSLTR